MFEDEPGGKFDNFDLGTKSFHRMNWVRNYFTPLTLLCSARHAGATPTVQRLPDRRYTASVAPICAQVSVQRLRARRHTTQCSAWLLGVALVQRLAPGRCTSAALES